MRISDWSSDVCSSDRDTEAAGRPNPGTFARPPMRAAAASRPTLSRRPGSPSGVTSNAPDHHAPNAGSRRAFRPPDPLLEPQDVAVHLRRPRQDPHHQPRSEEHTSELQSLMRISYAVFCLKKKKIHTTIKH